VITNRSLVAAVGPTQAPIFKFTGTVRGALLLILENLDDVNQLTYKVQESNDGVTWTDKIFVVGDSNVSTFVIDHGGAHTFRVQPATLHTRLVGSGSLTVNVGLSYSTAGSDSAPELYA